MSDPRHPMRLSLLALAMILVASICGCGSDGSNAPFNPNPSDQAPPLPPSGARIDWQLHGKFAVAWEKNTEPDLAGYRVYLYSPDPSRGNSYTCVSGNGLVQKNNLTISAAENQAYIFRVAAVDASGNESPMSEPLSFDYSSTPGQWPTGYGGQDDGSNGQGSEGTKGSTDSPAEEGGSTGW